MEVYYSSSSSLCTSILGVLIRPNLILVTNRFRHYRGESTIKAAIHIKIFLDVCV